MIMFLESEKFWYRPLLMNLYIGDSHIIYVYTHIVYKSEPILFEETVCDTSKLCGSLLVKTTSKHSSLKMLKISETLVCAVEYTKLGRWISR